MTEEELSAIQATLCRHANYFIPGCWFAQLAMQARKEGRIHDDFHLKTIIDVVTISVYTYFATVLLARQVVYKDPSPGNWNGTQSGGRSFGSAIYSVEFYFPVFTMLQFFFYMGWLKVAEQLINPLGEDDDDFEVNYLVDRNVQVGFLIVDDLYGKYPPLQRDVFWDTAEPEVPYTTATVETKINPFLGSTIDVSMPPGDMDWAPMFSGSGHPSPPDSPGSPVDAERHSAGSATPVSRPRHILRRFFSRGGSKRSLLTGSRLSIHRRSNLSSQKSLQILNDKRLPSVVISSRQGSRYGSRSSVNSSLQDDLVPFGSYSSVVASPDGVLPNNLPVPQPSLADPTPVANHVAPPTPQGPTPAPAPPQPEQPPAYNYSYNDEPLPAIAEEEPKPEDVADSGTDPGTQKGSPDPPSDMTAAVDETEGNGNKTPFLVGRTQAGDGQTDVTHGQAEVTQGHTDETPTHHVEQQPLLPSDSAMNPTV